jgi:hypothetical protein
MICPSVYMICPSVYMICPSLYMICPSVYMISRLDFGTVLTMWYFFLFYSIIYQQSFAKVSSIVVICSVNIKP